MNDPGLGGALPQTSSYKRTEFVVPPGAYRGYFLGLSEIVTEDTNFPCQRCKGSGHNPKRAGEDCFSCNATGKKTSRKVALRYQLTADKVQEEWVNYVLSEPGLLQDGTPKSPSRLWSRIRSLSGGIKDIKAQEEWYASLPRPVKLKVEVIIIDADSGSGLEIASVKPLGAAPAPVQHEDPDEPGF